MTTPKEIMRRVLSHANVCGDSAQVYIVADQVKALDAAGYAIVSKEPTVESLMAGRKQMIADMTGAHMGPSAENTYRVMIAAAQTKKAGHPVG